MFRNGGVTFILCPVSPVADKYLVIHSVCVKSLHETYVQTSWSFESGNILRIHGWPLAYHRVAAQCHYSVSEIEKILSSHPAAIQW